MKRVPRIRSNGQISLLMVREENEEGVPTVVEEVAPGARDDPFAWFNNPEQVEEEALAAAEKVRKEARRLQRNGV